MLYQKMWAWKKRVGEPEVASGGWGEQRSLWGEINSIIFVYKNDSDAMIFHKKYILIKSKKLCFGKSLKGSCQAAPVGLTSWSVAPVRRTGLKGLHTDLHTWQSLFSVLSSFNKGLLIFALYWASQIIEPVLSLGLRSLKSSVSLFYES